MSLNTEPNTHSGPDPNAVEAELKQAVDGFLGVDTRRRLSLRKLVPITIGLFGAAGAFLLAWHNDPFAPSPVVEPSAAPSAVQSPTPVESSASAKPVGLSATALARSTAAGQVEVVINTEQPLTAVVVTVGQQTIVGDVAAGESRFFLPAPPGATVTWQVSLAEGEVFAEGSVPVKSADLTASDDPAEVPEPGFPTSAPSPTAPAEPEPNYPDVPIGPTSPIDPAEQ